MYVLIVLMTNSFGLSPFKKTYFLHRKCVETPFINTDKKQNIQKGGRDN